MKGAFLTFEGIDGCGKSTQLRLLASELRIRGFEVITTREPGGTPFGNRLREALLDAEERVDPFAELLVFAADRAQHVRALVCPALESGHIVLSDRYADATVAYQGAGRGFNSRTIQQVVKLATDGLKPDLTLFFDLPVTESLMRTRQRHNEGMKVDRLDIEDVEFYTRVRKAYLEIAQAEPNRFRIIDASGAVEEIHTRVMEVVNEFFDGR
jgi:dTMP kinase